MGNYLRHDASSRASLVTCHGKTDADLRDVSARPIMNNKWHRSAINTQGAVRIRTNILQSRIHDVSIKQWPLIARCNSMAPMDVCNEGGLRVGLFDSDIQNKRRNVNVQEKLILEQNIESTTY